MPALFVDRRPAVLDLFSGCGGISLGFHLAGFHVAANVEMSAEAAASHAVNFHGCDDALRARHAVARDITQTDPHALLAEIGHEGPIDVIVGGPPCQAYARIGRAKLREVMAHPEAFTQDERGDLFMHYLRFVEVLRPRALVMENVPDILNYGGRNVAEQICDTLDEFGYEARYTLLNAASYGVPQYRERFILVALRRDQGTLPDVPFPAPTHSLANLPRGYQGTRSVATKAACRALDGTAEERARFLRRWVPIPDVAGDADLPPPVTVEEALRDLPPIRSHLRGEMSRGVRRLDTLVRYRSDVPLSDYARRMRRWPGFESSEGVVDHVIRYLPRDFETFRRMKPGDQYPEAHRVAQARFAEALARMANPPIVGSPEYEALHAQFVPPYDPGKFPNKWRKLEADRPSRTLMAHLGKDSYSHIHPSDDEARTISVREAARLQSFPDGFRFMGSMNPAFKQIGNAVPPLLAFAVAQEVKKWLHLPAEVASNVRQRASA